MTNDMYVYMVYMHLLQIKEVETWRERDCSLVDALILRLLRDVARERSGMFVSDL